MIPRLLRPALVLLPLLAAAPAAHATDLRVGLVLGGKKSHVAVHAVHRGTRWVPGHYETVERRVWIPEQRRKAWVEPVYTTRYDHCGRPYRVIGRAGRWRTVVEPGHYETTCVRVWVPGHYAPRH